MSQRTYRLLVVIGVVLHLILGVLVWWYLYPLGGVLPNSDELLYTPISDSLRAHWEEGLFVGVKELGVTDRHIGYYHFLGALRFLPGDFSFNARLVNVLLFCVAIYFWALSLKRAEQQVRQLFILFVLFTPSFALWSSFVLKEAWVYALFAGMLVCLSKIAEERRLRWPTLLALIVMLVFLGTMRSYIALYLWMLVAGFVAWQVSLLRAGWLALASMALMLAANSELLTLVGRLFFNKDVVVHPLEIFVGGQAIFLKAGPTAMDFVTDIREGSSLGNSAVDPTSPLWIKLWWFFTFPLPWQARSTFQWMAVPETVITISLLPAAIWGMFLEIRRRDPLALFLILFAIGATLIYTYFVANLGTLYRNKAVVLFVLLYFSAIGIVCGVKRVKRCLP